MRFNADLLLKERDKKGYTQQNIADKAGISREIIAKYETQKNIKPSCFNVYSISKVLNISMTEFIIEDEGEEN